MCFIIYMLHVDVPAFKCFSYVLSMLHRLIHPILTTVTVILILHGNWRVNSGTERLSHLLKDAQPVTAVLGFRSPPPCPPSHACHHCIAHPLRCHPIWDPTQCSCTPSPALSALGFCSSLTLAIYYGARPGHVSLIFLTSEPPVPSLTRAQGYSMLVE